jgi:hypothetical protein
MMAGLSMAELTVEYQDGWYYPVYRPFGTFQWHMVPVAHGSEEMICFKDAEQADVFLNILRNDLAYEGIHCRLLIPWYVLERR